MASPTSTRTKSDPSVVAINVGGQIFQTTKETLSLAGSNSLLSAVLSPSPPPSSGPESDSIPFIDRDPELFSVFLSLLRTGNLPSAARKDLDLQDLIFEAQYYGIESLLIDSLSNPSQFDAFNLQNSATLSLNGRDTPSAVSAMPSGSLHVAHGSKITSFDWSLRRKSTVLTQFAAVDSLLSISPDLAAAGATDFSGLQIIDFKEGDVSHRLNWVNATRSSSTVQAIGCSPEFIFTSFESGRRNSNAIVVYDLLGEFRPVTEIARNEIYGAEMDSAFPATKLVWDSTHNLLMAAGSHSGPLGVVGNIKLWDVRSGKLAWELKETEDCFSDVTFSNRLSSLFKVGVSSGEVFCIDLRRLGEDNQWVCLGDGRKSVSNGKREGIGCKIESHGSQVFRSKGGELELWSEVLMGSLSISECGAGGDRVFRRNTMGRGKDRGGSKITSLCFGGNKMFVTRKDQQSVEVWES